MPDPGPLGWIAPPDDKHKRLFSMAAVPEEVIIGAGGAFGIPWYEAFDKPARDHESRLWIIGWDPKNLGHIRGGHCIAGKVYGVEDYRQWYRFYNQNLQWPGKEEKDYSSCVGMGVCRVATNKNRRMYDPYDLYHWAQDHDDWDGNDYPGTSTRAGFECLRVRGPRRVHAGKSGEPAIEDGIEAYRWAESVTDIRRALNIPDKIGLIPMLQSWYKPYPHIVWMPDETVDRIVFREDGEFGSITDR